MNQPPCTNLKHGTKFDSQADRAHVATMHLYFPTTSTLGGGNISNSNSLVNII